MDAEYYIRNLNLEPHPEGGYFRETYRSEIIMNVEGINKRNVSTAIYFLLMNDEKSKFHRIKSDELWFFHDGFPLEILMIIDEKVQSFFLGNNLEAGEWPQLIVPANTWFAARMKNETGYALVSCTVAPGFDFSDFELADKKMMLDRFPKLIGLMEDFL